MFVKNLNKIYLYSLKNILAKMPSIKVKVNKNSHK